MRGEKSRSDGVFVHTRWPYICLAVYGVAVALVLLLPVGYSDIIDLIAGWIRSIPGLDFFGSGWIEFVANIAMFVPLGLLLTWIFQHHWYGVAVALAASALAEIAQIVIPSRQPSLRDVLANVLGAAIGAAIAWIILKSTAKRRKNG